MAHDPSQTFGGGYARRKAIHVSRANGDRTLVNIAIMAVTRVSYVH